MMENFKGTKGEWSISKRASMAIECNGRVICSTGGYQDSSRSEEVHEENQYNAYLISSAPELLESLKECLEGVRELNDEFQEGWDEVIEKAENIINKALNQ